MESVDRETWERWWRNALVIGITTDLVYWELLWRWISGVTASPESVAWTQDMWGVYYTVREDARRELRNSRIAYTDNGTPRDAAILSTTTSRIAPKHMEMVRNAFGRVVRLPDRSPFRPLVQPPAKRDERARTQQRTTDPAPRGYQPYSYRA
jgi:hypothetical protein